jgi:hypothetical protein
LGLHARATQRAHKRLLDGVLGLREQLRRRLARRLGTRHEQLRQTTPCGAFANQRASASQKAGQAGYAFARCLFEYFKGGRRCLHLKTSGQSWRFRRLKFKASGKSHSIYLA